jgi:hypothetical protein
MLLVPPPIFFKTPAAAAFAPTDLANLWTWLKSASGLTTSGGKVTAWADQSGSGHGATDPGNANNRLVVGATQNSIATLSGDATDFMNLPTMVGLTAATMFCVAKKNNDPPGAASSAGPVFSTGTSGTNTQWPFTDGVIYDGNGSNTRKTVGNPTPSLASYFVASIRSAANDYEFLLNGTSLVQLAVNTVAFSATPTIMSSGTSHFNGLVGEIIIYSTALSQANRQKVEGYLAWRWGIQSVLPVGHPYKLASP